jgi:hypothetical protein
MAKGIFTMTFVQFSTSGYIAIKNQYYAGLQKREKKILMDTTTMLNVRERLPDGEAIPEIYFGDEGMGVMRSVLAALSCSWHGGLNSFGVGYAMQNMLKVHNSTSISQIT